MNAGVVWALAAAVGFAFTQTINRKSNLLVGAFRTAFGMLVAVETILVIRMFTTGEHHLLADAPLGSLAYFSGSAFIHYIGGWTLLALSQRQIGVARTGAVVGAAPLVGTLLAAVFLAESLTVWTLLGVLMTVLGVALVSMSRAAESGRRRWVLPSFALGVAVCWGISPILIRKGLEGLDAPLLGLTIGLGVALVLHSMVLTATKAWSPATWDRAAVRWMLLGGVTGVVAIGAQWLSFDLTTIAIAITVQQLATPLVVALAPLMFDAVLERINTFLLVGTAAMLAGSVIVVWAG